MGMSEVVMLDMNGNSKGFKLLEHAMKVVERILEHRIRFQIIRGGKTGCN